MKLKSLLLYSVGLLALSASAGVVKVGNASYADEFPGTDKAGRNATPPGTPYLSGKAAGRPVPTNDWWSNELAAPHAFGIFNYPLALRPVDGGLVIINNMTGQGITADTPLTVGVEGVSATETTVCDYSDWTVTINWHNSAGDMNATIGLGMPMVYFTKTGSAPASINVTMGTVTIDGNLILVDGSYNGAKYVVFAPAGSTWTKEGTKLTSDLNGKDYWSVVMLPADMDVRKGASDFAKYAFVFPADTRSEWEYTPTSGEVRTKYIVTPDVKEGADNKVLMGMLPHQWGNLAGSEPAFVGSYATVRGSLKLIPGNEFETSLSFHGILPYLPTVTDGTAFSSDELKRLVAAVCKDNGFQDWTDSYNDAQLINRLVQTAEAAKASGDEEGFNTAFNLVKKQLKRWMTFETGDIDFLFYYHKPWATMLGYPAGHGQDSNINDHNFHWGYFIRAAAMIAQYDPDWLNGWGDMVNLLVRDVACADRNDAMFPYLRCFSPYAGHCWANGTASLSLGNDQESTSESMEFNTALMLWADVTGNMALRDLAVYLYVTELSAIEEYWFDIHSRNLDPSFKSALASRVFGNAYDDENFWGGGIAGSYGIQIYPVQAGSFYLVHDIDYAAKLWNAMSSETKILYDDSNPNIWYDTWIRFLAMTDPDAAQSLYDSCSHLGEKFGESQAHTYQWIHTLSAIGQPCMTLTASHPLAMAFQKDGIYTYIARNNTDNPLDVHFSDGFKMTVPPRSMSVEKAGQAQPSITLLTPAQTIDVNSPLALQCSVDIPEDSDLTITSVEYLIDDEPVACSTEAPYSAQWIPAAAGSFTLSARLTVSNDNTYTSKSVIIKVKAEDEPDILSCTQTDNEATEGSFSGDYTVRCETIEGDAVKITASFAGNYIGFAGPWLFDETDGFKEVEMTPVGDGLYSTTLTGLQDGDVVRFRVKIAFAGGLAVTRQFSYEVGSYCDDPGDDSVEIITKANICVGPNPTVSVWHVACEDPTGTLYLYNLDGILLNSVPLSGGHAVVDASALPAATYILQVVTPSSTTSLRLLRR